MVGLVSPTFSVTRVLVAPKMIFPSLLTLSVLLPQNVCEWEAEREGAIPKRTALCGQHGWRPGRCCAMALFRSSVRPGQFQM